jgi:hypothetical protein
MLRRTTFGIENPEEHHHHDTKHSNINLDFSV